jgi:DNA-binding transcriptional regulator LsrR (DeoR family)
MTDPVNDLLSGQVHSIQWDKENTSFELLSRVARLYYLEGKTQKQVGEELGYSRQKVQRLLQEARELRIVEIHVHSVPFLHTELESKLRELFNLKDVLIAPSHPDDQYRRYSVARAAANYLERILSPGMIVAVGLGRNASEIASFFRPLQPIDCTFVSAMGGSPNVGSKINPNQICGTFASKADGQAVMLYAPAYVESQIVRKTLMEQEAVKKTLNIARQADVAVMGIGTADNESILVRAGCVSQAEVTRLRSIGAVGNVLGNYFDREGHSLKSDLDGRLIALSKKDLLNVPLVIAAASERDKALPVLAALRARVVDTLIVDCDLGLEVLRLVGDELHAN